MRAIIEEFGPGVVCGIYLSWENTVRSSTNHNSEAHYEEDTLPRQHFLHFFRLRALAKNSSLYKYHVTKDMAITKIAIAKCRN